MNDPAYIKEVVDGDIHTVNQKAAGLETRDQAKTFIYAFIYGAGPAKIGLISGGDAKEGQKLIDSFLHNIPALKTLRSRVDKAAQRGYLVGLDKRKLFIRNKHAATNLLLQGAGAIICKQWLVEIEKLIRQHKLDVKLVASVHDEYQFECNKLQAKQFGDLTKQAMKETERVLHLKCPLDSEYKIGGDWSQTH
jgi:DNA polymerase I-like protein with 3'-5' exonuclease and polymerase domains